MSTPLGTCPTCGAPFPRGSARKPTKDGDDWSFAAIHVCAGTPQQQADAAAEAKRQKAQKAKPK